MKGSPFHKQGTSYSPMIKIYIAGASGTLSFEALKLLSKRGIPTKALIPRAAKQAKVKAGTTLLPLFKKRLAAKLNYFRNVIKLDVAAPLCRKISLEGSLDQLDLKTLP